MNVPHGAFSIRIAGREETLTLAQREPNVFIKHIFLRIRKIKCNLVKYT